MQGFSTPNNLIEINKKEFAEVAKKSEVLQNYVVNEYSCNNNNIDNALPFSNADNQIFKFNDQDLELEDDDDHLLRPLQFKLKNLKNTNLRYEVIYKNLLRDIRKFFIDDFNTFSSYNKTKKNNQEIVYTNCVNDYIITRNILNSDPYEGSLIGVTNETLMFCFGSFIYPKDMIKCLNPQIEKKDKKNLRRDLHTYPKSIRSIIKIYHYFYRFSLHRLQKFVNDPTITRFF
jgi:hypothetical protein